MYIDDKLYPVDQAVMVYNPRSSGLDAFRDELHAPPKGFKVVETSKNAEETFDRIAELITDGSVIITYSGDGGNNDLTNIRLSEAGKEAGLHEVPTLLRPAGYANDNARGLNGRGTLRGLLQHGKVAQVEPLSITVNDTDSRFALGYFGLGTTAAASQNIETCKSAPNRLDRLTLGSFARKANAAWRAAIHPQPFTIQEQAGVPQEVTDVLHLNGPHFAKIVPTKVSFADNEFKFLAQHNQGRLQGSTSMFRLLANVVPSVMTVTVSYEVVSEAAGRVPAQYDGETAYILSGSTIDVTSTGNSLAMITTKL